MEHFFIACLKILVGVISLGLMILIHEFGHFITAKAFKFKILAFAIGFGKAIISKKVGDTEYRVNIIPFGGYVKMGGDNPDDADGDIVSMPQSKPRWQRALVAAAGPLANLLTGILVFFVMFLTGVREPVIIDRPVVGTVLDSMPGFYAGIRAGDSILTVNGAAVATWSDVEDRLILGEKMYTVSYRRAVEVRSCSLNVYVNRNGKVEMEHFGMFPEYPPVIAEVEPGSPADKAGLKPGDSILSISGTPVPSWDKIRPAIQLVDSGKPALVALVRGTARLTLSMIPLYNAESKSRIIGIRQQEHTVRYPPHKAAVKCYHATVKSTKMIFTVIGKLVQRKIPMSQLSGPVGIIPISGYVLFKNVPEALAFNANISINLAVLNLFPLIITDGGLLLFLLIEAIRRRPLSIKTQMVINQIGIALFILFFLFVTFNDVNRFPEIFKALGK
jgi:regulator of sigma E protease